MQKTSGLILTLFLLLLASCFTKGNQSNSLIIDTSHLLDSSAIYQAYLKTTKTSIESDSAIQHYIVLYNQLLDNADSIGLDKKDYLRSTFTSYDSLIKKGKKPGEDWTETTQSYFKETALQFLFDAAYGKDIKGIKYSGVKLSIDTTKVFKLLNELLSSDNWGQVLRQCEPKTNEYPIFLKEYRALLELPSTENNSKINQLKVTLNSYRWRNRIPQKKYVLVNIPSTFLSIVNADSTQPNRMRVIVGNKAHQTPIFTAYLTQVRVYPYWLVPFSIATNEILPKVKKDIGYLKKQEIDVINGKGDVVDPHSLNWARFSKTYFPYNFRQSTGCDNSLGLVMFDLNSPYSIYLHDTNAGSLFEQEQRHLSHGCIRVQKPIILAENLLGGSIDSAVLVKLQTCLKDEKPTNIPIKVRIPVLILYYTADLDEKGKVVYYEDVYELNK